MKAQYLTLLIFQFLITKAGAQTCEVNTFQKTYGTASLRDEAYDIIESPSGGYITGGWGGNHSDSCLLMKVDRNGNIVWAKQITGSGTTRGFMKRFIRVNDGHYIAAGRAYDTDNPHLWIIKFDENGDIIWNKKILYPNGWMTDPSDICATADGGFALTGFYQPFPNSGGSLIIKFNSNGDQLWSRGQLGTLSGSDILTLTGIIEKNGNLFIVGRDYGNVNGLVIKIGSSDGIMIGQHAFKVDNKHTSFYNIKEKNNKLYINGYNTDNQSFDGLKQVVTIVDDNLAVLKVHKFGLNFSDSWETPGMAPTSDGGFIAAESDENNSDLLLFKVSYEGIVEWKRKYPRNGFQVTFGIRLASDNGLIGIGTSNDFGSYWNYQNNIFIYKTDPAGLTLGCAVEDIDVVIVNPVFTKNQTTYTFNALSLSSVDITSSGKPLSVPIQKFCEHTVTPNCSSIKISGDDSLCNLQDTVTYKAVRNNNCNATIAWAVDTNFTKILSSTDSTIAVQFIRTGTTKIVSSISDLCEVFRDSISIQIISSPTVVDLGTDIRLCQNSTVTLHAGVGFKNYLWQDGSVDSVFAVGSPGVYHVTATNYCNEQFNDTVSISAAAVPANFLPKDTVICEGILTTINSLSGFASYLWSTGETRSQIQTSSTGIYWLRVMNSDGCYAKEEINVRSKDSCMQGLYFPNAFTPNNDGLNDRFKGIAFGVLKTYHLRVYNRFGAMVFETYDSKVGWTGKFKGMDQSSGTFVWFCEYQFNDQLLQMKKGTVNLIR
ncbi:MAG TPA: gliding motility-associated C-terminal domain-containing protein [Chitinophagaceae bacterium]|nr:gliding motility-associated C-terminal domain-containing protein [Chitinophagaceae bacterium]